MEYHKLTLRIPKELHRRVKAKAAMEDTTITAVVKDCLERWIEEHPPEHVQSDEQ